MHYILVFVPIPSFISFLENLDILNGTKLLSFQKSHLNKNGVNLTIQDLWRQDLYFNIPEMKQSITSLYIISVAPKYDIIRTENAMWLIASF